MPIYLINAHADVEKNVPLEQKIRGLLPNVIKSKNLETITRQMSGGGHEFVHVIFLAPSNDATYVDLLIRAAEAYRRRIFFILVSDEISGSDYKRLMRSGGADWVSANAPAQEILDIVVRPAAGSDVAVTERARPVLVSFVPSAGGVGNSTLAIEVAMQLRRGKATANRRVCLIDLDFQTSHVCDYLDIEPRLHIAEISANPNRLDSQLFEVFVTHHSSGLDVFASPRSKFDTCGLDFAALDGLFGLISTRYDLILIDFPVNWLSWTPKIIAASSGIIVNGVNSIPGLRQIAEALTTLRATTDVFGEIRVAINNCERGLFGRVARRQHVESVLPGEQIFYVRNDPAVLGSINTGMPMALSDSRRRISKDIAKITEFCSGLTSPSAAMT
jgi:pilus assembly protein CpaE